MADLRPELERAPISLCFVRINFRGGENSGNVPVDVGLPNGIVKTIEDIEEHVSNISGILPIFSNEGLGCCLLASVCLGKGVSTTPDGHGENEEEDEAGLCSDGTTDSLNIEGIAKEQGADNLGKVVQQAVEGLCAGVKVGSIDGVELVGVEPVRGPEHGEEKDYEGLESDGLVESNELGLPAGILHQDNAGAVWSDNIGGIAE